MTSFKSLIFKIFIFLGFSSAISQESGITLTSSCCSLTSGSCKATCEEITLVELATNNEDRWRYLSKLNNFCSQKLMLFWSCMNQTLSEIDEGQNFFGRPCCTLPQSQACIMVCLKAEDRHHLTAACRPSNEITFYSCLERQEVGQQCCNQATRAECAGACKELFASTSEPSVQMRTYVSSTCAQDHPSVNKCIKNYTLLTPAQNPSRNLHCCDHSTNSDCQLACRNILRTQTIGQEIVDNLIDGGCGSPMPHDKLWQCFLTNSDANKPEPKSVSRVDGLGMDSAKLQCCFRAATITCQRLCIKTYSNEWEETWGKFDRQCQYQLAESPMLSCLVEIDEPCELGCSGLSYCSHFNHRPTELFRNCDVRTDAAARHDVDLWEGGVIRMPTIDVPVKDIRTCKPHLFKTIACALQIKPCRSRAHADIICRKDCIELLEACVDRSRLLEGQTPSTICDVLSPPGINLPCISLEPFLQESNYPHAVADVSHPCKANTCATNEACLVNRDCYSGETCPQFICVPGCRMGAVSQLVIPGGTYTQVPRIFKGKHCNYICYCNRQGIIDNCVALPCISKGHCSVLGHEVAHKGQYIGNCTKCFCFAGELRCTNTCTNDFTPRIDLISAIPMCSCNGEYSQVCGSNGKSYTSVCAARCSGLKESQTKSGLCSEIDPCRNNNCGNRKRCVAKRQICLSLKKKCPQYVCVPKDNCEDKPQAPVCDTENDEHPNACLLLERKRTLAYVGKCLSKCQRKGLVCGHDGLDYWSECATWAEKMSIDYRGPCLHTRGIKDSCAGVTCQPLPSKFCTGMVPPNSCCPICGIAIKLVYSQRLLEQASDAIHTIEPATVSEVAKKLQEHIKTFECDISTYMDEDGTIVAIVYPTTSQPSELLIEACFQEATKIQSLVDERSPTLVTEFPLSALIGSHLVHPLSISRNMAVSLKIGLVENVICLLLVLFTIQIGNVT